MPLTLDKTVTLSRVIARAPFPGQGDRASVAEFATTFNRLAFSAAIFFFAALNVIPAPPGLSLFLGIPLVILSVRKALGMTFWLPDFVMNARISRQQYSGYRDTLLRWMHRIEIYMKPRGRWHRHPGMSRFLDMGVAILSVCVLTPLPFTAILPALSICVITLGRLEHDGLWISVGLGLSLVAITVYALALYGSGRLYMLAFGLG